jgi:hypothetical protein
MRFSSRLRPCEFGAFRRENPAHAMRLHHRSQHAAPPERCSHRSLCPIGIRACERARAMPFDQLKINDVADQTQVRQRLRKVAERCAAGCVDFLRVQANIVLRIRRVARLRRVRVRVDRKQARRLSAMKRRPETRVARHIVDRKRAPGEQLGNPCIQRKQHDQQHAGNDAARKGARSRFRWRFRTESS